jgi:hypothetical protein
MQDQEQIIHDLYFNHINNHCEECRKEGVII